MQPIRLFHRTSTAAADSILAKGFRDHVGKYMTNRRFRGVWFSAGGPLDENEGAGGDAVLVIEVPDHVAVRYEWVEESKPYREFLIPARIVNRYGPPRHWLEDEEPFLSG